MEPSSSHPPPDSPSPPWYSVSPGTASAPSRSSPYARLSRRLNKFREYFVRQQHSARCQPYSSPSPLQQPSLHEPIHHVREPATRNPLAQSQPQEKRLRHRFSRHPLNRPRRSDIIRSTLRILPPHRPVKRMRVRPKPQIR